MIRIRQQRFAIALAFAFLAGHVSLVVPAREAAAVESWRAVGADMAAAAPAVSFLAAEVKDGDCFPVFGVQPDRRVGVASTFKLYVLAELARQVATGRASWDEALPISEDWKSKPSGAMRYEAPGTEHTLRFYAERMIAESDNTATDHLIARLGRENVEAVQAILGHGEPELNTPLLMTRELFAIKIAADPTLVDAYVGATDAEQRRILETIVAPVRLAPDGWGNWNGPEWIESIEWFASARDLCLAMARLQEMSERPELQPITQILALNRGGTTFDRSTWPYAGFKMGSEAGVYNLTWLLRRSDGRRFVVTAGFNDPRFGVDQARAWALIGRVEALLAKSD